MAASSVAALSLGGLRFRVGTWYAVLLPVRSMGFVGLL
jgi:hypothetical protein